MTRQPGFAAATTDLSVFGSPATFNPGHPNNAYMLLLYPYRMPVHFIPLFKIHHPRLQSAIAYSLQHGLGAPQTSTET